MIGGLKKPTENPSRMKTRKEFVLFHQKKKHTSAIMEFCDYNGDLLDAGIQSKRVSFWSQFFQIEPLRTILNCTFTQNPPRKQYFRGKFGQVVVLP